MLPDRKRAPRAATWALLAFTLVVLLALAFLPVFISSRIEPRRAMITDVAEPALDLTGDVQLSLAREMAALRGYLATGEPRFLDSYRSVRRSAEAVLPRLDSLSEALDGVVPTRLDSLRATMDRWDGWVQQSGLLTRGWASDDYVNRMSVEQEMYDLALQRSLELEARIRDVQEDARSRIASLEGIGSWVSRALVFLALAAMLGVGWLGRQLWDLDEELDRWARKETELRRAADDARAGATRRAREERALRRAAEEVSGAYTVEEVTRRVAASALTAAKADGAVVRGVASAGGDEEVLATAGIPADRNEMPDDAPSVVFPLGEGQQRIGSLVLLRRSGSPRFNEADVVRGRIFAELAALALRKAHLFQAAERRRSELERVTESRSRLIRGFSHDLKNPLGAADANAALLESGVTGALSEAQRESLSRIRSSLQSAFHLISELVELGRVEAGQLRIQMEPVDVSREVGELVAQYRAQAAAAGLQLRMGVDEPVSTIMTDPERLRQILGNLLSNAVKYTKNGSVEVHVRARGGPGDQGGGVDLEVTDTGPGIPEEKLGLLFLEFSRLEVSDVPGAGLGLAISHRLAKAVGGDLTVRSHEGRGSTFVLSLPRELGSSSPGTHSSVTPESGGT